MVLAPGPLPAPCFTSAPWYLLYASRQLHGTCSSPLPALCFTSAPWYLLQPPTCSMLHVSSMVLAPGLGHLLPLEHTVCLDLDASLLLFCVHLWQPSVAGGLGGRGARERLLISSRWKTHDPSAPINVYKASLVSNMPPLTIQSPTCQYYDPTLCMKPHLSVTL